MASSGASKAPSESPVSPSLASLASFRDRRGSVNSIALSATTTDKEHLSNALDKIHTSASQSNALTTFNDFAPPPVPVPAYEHRNSAGDIVQQGFSGLYSRFREAVGGGSPTKSVAGEEGKDRRDTHSRNSSVVEGHASKGSISSLSRSETASTLSTQQGQNNDMSSSAAFTETTYARSQTPASSKATSISLMTASKAPATGRQSLATNAKSSVVADPTIAPIIAHRGPVHGSLQNEESFSQSSKRQSMNRSELQAETAALYDPKEGKLPPRTKREDTSSLDGSVDTAISPGKSRAPPVPTLPTHHSRSPSAGSSMLSPAESRRRPVVIDRISRPRSPAYSGSRDSSPERFTAEASTISTSAHNTVYHDSFTQDSQLQPNHTGGLRIPGTALTRDGSSEQVNAQLERMRRQVLSKEFWMKDDTVKECFICQTPFSAFRRKHHCRTCGCIFDSKCTTVISGEKFGVQGSLRVCKRCLDVISRRLDGSGSDDSGDEQSFMPRFFGAPHAKSGSTTSLPKTKEQEVTVGSEDSEDARQLNTPMMAIPATRRMRGESNRSSAVLEIDAAVQLSRPGSSRSLKSMNSPRPHSSAGHKRHHSKHAFLGRTKPLSGDRAPFRKRIEDENAKKPKFPAFHDDNIIDPELADYMSDESSGDDQGSIFATMSSNDLYTGGLDNERNFAPYVNSSRRHRHSHRGGEKSITGMSHVSRGALDESNRPSSLITHRRTNRRRNLSNASGTVYYMGSPRPKSAVLKGPSGSSEMGFPIESPHMSTTQLTRSDSIHHWRNEKMELNKASLKHIDRLLQQLLEDARLPEPQAWQKTLLPIFLQSTDDVSPDVGKGEAMDIRHFVKLKKIPGGKTSDTSYVSGVIFTKNLALKSMPRRILNPRIVLVTFPIEYQRHQQHLMSLQPVIEQEKEFLRVMVQRITNLRPQVLLAEKGISGVALQYLSEANVSVAYNVKHTVIEAVSRCAQTEIITSSDMLALPVQVGKCASFDVRTFVNNDHPGRKKSYVFISGCRPDLGCTIALRGANSAVLSKVKYIVEFMVYVVYNLKLESSLLKDESIQPNDDDNGSMTNSFQAASDSFRSGAGTSMSDNSKEGPTVVVNQPIGDSEPPSQVTGDSLSIEGESGQADSIDQASQEDPNGDTMREDRQISPETQVPDDVPMPTFYSDMVAKYETKILSASPYVKFSQPYLLMKAREQERRLLYLRRLRDHDAVEAKGDPGKARPQKFQLIQPEMANEIGQEASKQNMEVLHAVHDAEYDKALFNYKTQTRQWESHIQGNLDLFDPYSHQNIVVLYSIICTESKVPCLEPDLVAINFYDEQHVDTGMDADCTLGHYIGDLIFTRHNICSSFGCDKKLTEHHRTYVHDQSRVTIFVENVSSPTPRISELGAGITMWTYCKLCKKDSKETAMSESTFKYSFGKYLELLYWGRGLRMKEDLDCPHDHRRDHIRYFSLDDARIRVHWDPIDLLEIIVPRPRITWKVVNDLKLKNEIFGRMERRWQKFMGSVKARLTGIRTDSVLPDKAEDCKAELDRLSKKASEDQHALIRRLQGVYANSKFYEIVPFNSMVREMLEKAGEWDQTFLKFEADFLGDKDMRQLTMMQLKKMFADNESKDSIASEGTGSTADSDERPSQTFSDVDERTTQPTEYTDASMEASVDSSKLQDEPQPADEDNKSPNPSEESIERVEPLDLAGSPAALSKAAANAPQNTEQAMSPQQSPSPTRISRIPTDTSLAGKSLSEKVDQMRREQASQSRQVAGSHGTAPGEETPRQASDQVAARRSGPNASPPMTRAISQPARTLPRTQSSKLITNGKSDGSENLPEQLPEGSIKADKKLSDRLGLGALKTRNKTGVSNIPRPTKRKESKVSTLARHFEQLSREFEKERIRDRKKRAASSRQTRAMLPKSSSKAIVQVYDDVNEAFDEPAAMYEQVPDREGETKMVVPPSKAIDDIAKHDLPAESASLKDETLQTDDPSREGQDDAANMTTSQIASDDEGMGSDLEPTVSEEYLPDIKELADSLEPSAEIPFELPKHQKTSLMKYLTNFWAERSASGWPPLEYPVNVTDHIFVDSNIIVREDEPSSLIAWALDSDDYQGKLSNMKREVAEEMQREAHPGSEGPEPGTQPRSLPLSDDAEFLGDKFELERSLLHVTETHLKYQVKEGSATMTCKIFYAEQFDALRRKCGVSERIIESLSRCLKWDSQGGKTKSIFLKTLDDRLVLKVSRGLSTEGYL